MASECRSTIEYRAFRNADLEQLAEIWRSQPQQRGLMQPMSVAVLERFVFSKPMFDRRGLIVALDGDTLVGFAHAGFGPTSDRASLSTAAGATALVMLRAETETAVAGELLARAEDYLRAGGARAIYGGGSFPLAPFYFGLYGGSELSGVMESDERLQSLFREAGYHPSIRSLVLQRELGDFRPPIDRQQLQIRRQTIVEMVVDPPTTSWWEACLFEPFERTRAMLVDRNSGALLAVVNFWNLETMAGTWGVQAVGMAGVEVDATRRRQGLATYLLGDALSPIARTGHLVGRSPRRRSESRRPDLVRAAGLPASRRGHGLSQGLTQDRHVLDHFLADLRIAMRAAPRPARRAFAL